MVQVESMHPHAMNSPITEQNTLVATHKNGGNKQLVAMDMATEGKDKTVSIFLLGKPILKVEAGTTLKVVKLLYEAEFSGKCQILGVRPKTYIDNVTDTMPCIVTLDESRLNELSYDILVTDGRSNTDTEQIPDRNITTRCMDCSRESWKSKKFTSVGMNTEISINPLLELDPRTVPNANGGGPPGPYASHSQPVPNVEPSYTNRSMRARSGLQRPMPVAPICAMPHRGGIIYTNMPPPPKDYGMPPSMGAEAKTISSSGHAYMDRGTPISPPTAMYEPHPPPSKMKYPSSIALDAITYNHVPPSSRVTGPLPPIKHSTSPPMIYQSGPQSSKSSSAMYTRLSPTVTPHHIKTEKVSSHPPVLIECSPGNVPRGEPSYQRQIVHRPLSPHWTYEKRNSGEEMSQHEYVKVVQPPRSDNEDKSSHPTSSASSSRPPSKEMDRKSPVAQEDPPVYVLPNDFDMTLSVDPGNYSETTSDRQQDTRPKVPVSPHVEQSKHEMEISNEGEPYMGHSSNSDSPKSGNEEAYESPDSQSGQPQRLYCKICHKVFPTKSMLYKHLRGHTSDEKPFKCNECGQGFTLSSNLRQHRIIHRGYKPFQCEFCGKKFMRSNVYKQHRRIHTGEEMHKCGLCPSEFLQKYALIKHMKKAHDIDALEH